MLMGLRLRQLREERDLSQGDVAELTGLLHNHVSRVENNHTTPSVETLEKLSHAFGPKLYQLLYEPDVSPPNLEPITG